MCGRFVQDSSKEFFSERLRLGDVGKVPTLPPSHNLPPSRPAYVVGYNPEAERRGLAVMSWGLVPRWWKETLKEARRPINATAEGILEKPTFRDSFARRRCLVPVTGFYEWRKGEGPYYFKSADDEFFTLGGVWDCWTGPDGEKLHSFAVITTTPNELVREIHDRMPVIIPADAWEAWLDPRSAIDDARSRLVPYPAKRMSAYPVSKLVNSPRNNGPELLLPSGQIAKQ